MNEDERWPFVLFSLSPAQIVRFVLCLPLRGGFLPFRSRGSEFLLLLGFSLLSRAFVCTRTYTLAMMVTLYLQSQLSEEQFFWHKASAY